MDPVSQGVVGAVFGQAFGRKEEMRPATLAAIMGGMAADLDILIHSSTDPLMRIEWHRHFTHSLLFIPFGALIVAVVAWPLFKSRLAFKRHYLYCFLGYLTAGPLDACTSYGTHLLWPFSAERTAWYVISIVDLAFTLPLIAMAIMAAKRRSPLIGRCACVFALAYLSLGFVQRSRAEDVARNLAKERGHTPAQLIAKPTISNLVLWRINYRSKGRWYTDGVRLGTIGANRVYEGPSVPVLDLEAEFPVLAKTKDSVQWADYKRFEFFSDGHITRHPEEPTVIGDLRYAILADSVHPLWGIRTNPEAPSQHVEWVRFSRLDAETRAKFWERLAGRGGREFDKN